MNTDTHWAPSNRRMNTHYTAKDVEWPASHKCLPSAKTSQRSKSAPVAHAPVLAATCGLECARTLLVTNNERILPNRTSEVPLTSSYPLDHKHNRHEVISHLCHHSSILTVRSAKQLPSPKSPQVIKHIQDPSSSSCEFATRKLACQGSCKPVKILQDRLCHVAICNKYQDLPQPCPPISLESPTVCCSASNAYGRTFPA
jgi:hypothetical protein